MHATAQDVLGHCAGTLAIRLRHAWAHARCKRKCWFFYRAVVIRMQCSRSPRALDDNRHSLRLGGQHGEEAKDEDEVSGEEGRAQDKAPEEEVKYSPLSVFDFEGVVDCVTRAGASRRAVSASRRASTPPVPVDGRGRRRDGGSGPTDLGDFRKAGPRRIFAPRRRQWRYLLLVPCPGLSPTPSVIPDMISPTLFPRLGLVLPTGGLLDPARVPI
jgi:hypothetical protein